MKRVFTVFLAVCLLASVGIAAFADASDFPWGSLDVQQIVISGGVSRLRAEPYKGMTGITEVVLNSWSKNFWSIHLNKHFYKVVCYHIFLICIFWIYFKRI